MAKRLTHGKILTALHKGAVLTVEHINGPASSAKKVYRLSSTNQAVTAEYVADLLANGLIKPNNDGLPGLGESQTYSLVRSTP
jgi:hypothetical protein